MISLLLSAYLAPLEQMKRVSTNHQIGEELSLPAQRNATVAVSMGTSDLSALAHNAQLEDAVFSRLRQEPQSTAFCATGTMPSETVQVSPQLSNSYPKTKQIPRGSQIP